MLTDDRTARAAATVDNGHTKSIAEVFSALATGHNGLSIAEAERRLEEVGPNELRREARVSPVTIFLHQFKEFLIIILLVATAISLALGELLDAIVIFIIVVLSALLGFIQEYRASRALEALKRIAAPTADVLRDGQEQNIPAREIVPGDIVILTVGDAVPADGRLIEAYNLKLDESAFTGESVPVDKHIEPLPEDVPLAERANLVYSGTTVIYGRGAAVVVATGMKTEFGKIAHLVQMEDSRHSPLELRMEEIGRRLGVAALFVVGIVVGAGLLRGEPLLAMFFWGVSLAVAAVPEALPAIVTGALTLGVQRMVKRNAIVRRLPAVETLGSVTTICSDKTGTLTRNEMTVRRIWLGGQDLEVTGLGYEPQGALLAEGQSVEAGPDVSLLSLIAVLCNDARLLRDESGRHHVLGDPTEGALLVMAAKVGFEPEPLRIDYPRVEEIPFSSVRKMMTTINKAPEGHALICTKGAPEAVLQHCSHYLVRGKPQPLTASAVKEIMAANERMAGAALRVLAFAFRELRSLDVEATEDFVEKNLVFIGIVGMVDPPRDEVKVALAVAEQAGVRTVMITGDHKLTAVAIARELGMLQEGGLAMTGSELDRVTDEDLTSLVDRVAVYARTSPEHKLRLVTAMQKKGQIAAMTGDGINDAPALRQSDIGVAMGISGTDVTKEAADMVLADDNYATIVAAIEEGRVIYDNIRKFIRYLLSTNTGEILTVFVAVLVGLPMPLLAIQILWINLVTDGLPALALGVEPAEPGVMRRPPRPAHESVFARGMWQHIVWVGVLMAVGTLGVMVWGLNRIPLDTVRTMVFFTLAAYQMFHVLAIRSELESILTIGFFSNVYMVGAVALTFLLQLAVTYLPPLQVSFSTRPLDPVELSLCIVVSSTVFWAVEFEKLLLRHGVLSAS